MKAFNPGDTVLVKKYNITGKVIEKINDKEYRVTRKNQSFTVAADELTVINKNAKYETIRVEESSNPLDKIYEMDFHGYTKSEVLKEVAYVIENYAFHQYPIIKITHGKGKGVFRMSIHELLRKYKERGLIKFYEYAADNKGGYGVTIVYIE